MTITYTLRDRPGFSETQFDDVVEYRGKSKPASSKKTRISGVDTLQSPTKAALKPTGSTSSATVAPPPTRFRWRGSGLLFFTTSRWQLLGYGPASTAGPAWAVTYFEKTLFTPEGLDLYARHRDGVGEDQVKEIKRALAEVGGNVGKLADKLFEVERS